MRGFVVSISMLAKALGTLTHAQAQTQSLCVLLSEQDNLTNGTNTTVEQLLFCGEIALLNAQQISQVLW